MRICVIEAADFRTSFEALQNGADESYQGQTYSTSFIHGLKNQADRLTIVGIKVQDGEDSTDGNVDYRTLFYWAPGGPEKLNRILTEAAPTHVILRVPVPEILNHPAVRRAKVAAMLADSFSISGWSPKAIRQRFRYRRLSQALNRPNVELVANHNRAATRDLVGIGVDKGKTIPWEWPTPRTPEDFSPKSLQEGEPIKLLYVGALKPAKGIDDLLVALASNAPLRARAHLTLIGGKGDPDALASRARELGVADKVTLAGILPNKEVFERMRDAHVVLVPSHHAYPEGLPKTIRESLTVRTPVVMSDHPMFQGYFSSNHGAVMVPEKSPEAIANAVMDILDSPEIFAVHSNATARAFAEIDCPNKWADIIGAWLAGDPQGYLKDRLGHWDET